MTFTPIRQYRDKMRNTLAPKQTQYKYYSRLRALAITALICTAAVALIIIVESALPGNTSNKQSTFVSDKIQSIISGAHAPVDSAKFNLFIRKFLGHFMIFAALGAGLSACSFLLIKPRAIYPLTSAACATITAFLSEALQLPVFNTGRVASLTDVQIDITGAICGILFFSLLLCAYILIKRMASQKKYRLLKAVFVNAHAKTLFGRCGKIIATETCQYKRSYPQKTI